jgi:hypothetical protein
MIAWLPLLGIVAAAAGGLQVDTSTPDALCPDVGQVREAAQARLGDIEAEGSWRASYALIHRPDRDEAGDVVRLELHDPMGRLRLRRDLPRAGESCAALAGALVVVLDGYFRHPTEPIAVAPAPTDAAANGPALATRGQPAAPRDTRLALDLTGGWAGGWAGADQSSPLLALGVRVAVPLPAWWAGVEGTWLTAPQTEKPAQDATATLRSYAVRAFFAYDLAHGLAREVARDPGGGGGAGRIALLVGPEAVLALDHADGAMLPQGSAGTRPAVGGGARAHLQVAITSQLRLGVLAVLDYLPSAWSGSFLLEQAQPGRFTELFPAPRLRLMIGAGVSWAVF